MHPDNNNGIGLLLISWISKVLSIIFATISANLSFISNLICIGCALGGLFFSWQNWRRNRRIDAAKKDTEKEPGPLK